MRLPVDTSGPLPIGHQLTPPLAHVIRGDGPPDQAPPSVRERANLLVRNPNTVARTIEDLNRSGYRPLHPSPGGA